MFSKKLWIEYTLLFFGFLWSLVSYFYSISGEPDIWFARSGAILVLFAIIVEYRLSKMLQTEINNSNVVAGLGIPAGVSVPKANSILSIVTHITVLLGTIVWAYGDLLHT